MALHVELRAAELMREGHDEESAMDEARRLFARDARALEALYATAIERDDHMRLRERLESLTQDVRYALRGLIRERALTAFIVITLALGIGANVTAWSLVDRLLLRDPAHVVDAERVIRLYSETDMGERGLRTSSWMPYSAYLQFRDLRSFESAGAHRIVELNVGVGADARRLRVGQTLGAFFPLLGVEPAAGRLFAAAEDAATAGELAILSHELWRTDHGSDADVIGRGIIVGDVAYTIIGVAPPGFTGTQPRRVDVWVLASPALARTTNWNVIGRLRPGVTAEAAAAEATATHVPDATGSFAWFRDARIFTAPLSWGDDGREPIEGTLARWLAAVTAIILLITFANVVNLLLVRIARRRRELAIRVSLGAGRARVMRLIAVEGVLLAVFSGSASLIVARMLEPMVRSALMADQAGWTFAIMDARLLGIVGVIVLLTVICVGTVPALQAGNPHVSQALQGGQRAGSASLGLRGTLTVVQAALSVVLLVGAGLFLRSFANVRALDLGVDRDRVITVEATLRPLSDYRPGTSDDHSHMERDIYRRLESAVQGVPGVEQAAVAIGLPLDGGSFSATVQVPGRDSIPTLPGGGPYVSTVTAGYFNTIGTRIVRGRAFSDADREGSEPVVIVNETMARTLWANDDALDQCMHVGGAANPCSRIIGVAEDVHRTGLREQPSFQYYLPLGQQSMFGGAKLVVRPVPGAPASATALRQAVVEADPAVRAVEIRSLDESLAGELRPLRIGMVTFGISGALALAVAVLGLYSMMAYMVAWRTHEIGVRVALGASRSNVIALVLRSGIVLAGAGIAIGLALAGVAGRWLQPHLFDTAAVDATVMMLVAAALMITAASAGWLPARRATRISPTEALRSD
jgi:predicted permease